MLHFGQGGSVNKLLQSGCRQALHHLKPNYYMLQVLFYEFTIEFTPFHYFLPFSKPLTNESVQ